MTPQTVSVVVIGRNEGLRLRRCLQSVAVMERNGFEIETIYVDSGSSDGSVAEAASQGAETIKLRPARPTAALGRNAGWRQATGTIILFLDGDTILHPRFVADSLAAFEDERVAVVWGHRRETFHTDSIYNRVLDLDWIYPAGEAAFCGGDALFRRSVLETTGGYDDTLIAGEEPELCRRITSLGLRILHVDRPMTGHDLAITRFSQYWKRATRAGHAFAEVSSRFAATDHPFWLTESRNNRQRALCLLCLIGLAAIGSVTVRSPLIAAAALGLIALLAFRTAWKTRWKSNEWPLLLLYGLHSHLQQIPIFFGQLQFWRNQRRGQRARLVEYKRP
jgi:cellulose synthase/poly-beta-1,6-N-acetylglucosamine synthase-like glycosyltransferase